MTHIQMPDVTPIVRYLADGDETVFVYPFPIFASEDLAVYINGAKQVSGIWAFGLSVLGIYVYKRSEEKKYTPGEGIYWSNGKK